MEKEMNTYKNKKMNNSVEKTAEEEEKENKFKVEFDDNLSLKASILLQIQNEMYIKKEMIPEIKIKFCFILYDLKSHLLQKKSWKLLYSTILIQLLKNSSERRKSKLWDDLISDI